MPKKAARAAVRQMRQPAERPLLDSALADGDITHSLTFTIADWTRTLPAAMRTETDRILLDAARAGACLDDLAAIAGCAIEKWRHRPAVYCDVHHLRHLADGGETALSNCALVCQFHHDVCIHRRGWQLFVHCDGTTEARSRDGRQVLYSDGPPPAPGGAET
jgi:hypothetical protein